MSADAGIRRNAPQHAAAVVLVAEDDPGVRELHAEILRLAGYQVVAACDGVETLEIIERTPVDLVLLDLVMPRLSGWDVLARLATTAVRLPRVLVVTASHDLRGADRHPLVTGVLTKSGDIDALLAAVRRALRSAPMR